MLNSSAKDLWDGIKKYFPEEWKDFEFDEEVVRKEISKFARELPVDVYKLVRDKVLDQILKMEDAANALLSFIVDSNIIVMDAFRVGQGLPSTTERIFSSPFVKLYAPKSIESEVYTQIEADIPDGYSLESANEQARKLISKIELIDDSLIDAYHEEFPDFERQFGKDISFLRVGLGMEVKTIISRDRDFEHTTVVKRIELGEAVGMIVSVEAGSLSITMIGAAPYFGAKLIYYILYALYRALFEIFGYVSMIVSAGVAGMAKLISKIPAGVWYVLLGIAIGSGIAIAVSKDLREEITKDATKLYEWVGTQIEVIYNGLTNFIKGIIDITNSLKDQLGPYFMITVLGMMLTIEDMTNNLEKQ